MQKKWSLLLLPLALALTGQDSCQSSPDEDGDGYSVEQGDCDDANAAVYPDAAEVCDGIDNNCDAKVDPMCWGSAQWSLSNW